VYISSLEFKNFRNLKDGSIKPDKNINVIYGSNAQGKTNLLEAFWLFTGGHSFRGNRDSELGKIIDGKNSESIKLNADFFSEGREQTAEININDGKRSSVINGVQKKTGSALLGKVCEVIFSPEHLTVVKEGPQKRRDFIDSAICQLRPSYAKQLSRYSKALLQRNMLLKDIGYHSELADMIDIWNDRMVSTGSEIINERINYIKKLAPYTSKYYSEISEGKEKMELTYTALDEDIDKLNDIRMIFEKKLKENEKTDLKQGFTSVGPHRDDFTVSIDGKQTKIYGSQGQQRSVVISLKLAEAAILNDYLQEPPIILLDDVMSELDSERQSYLLNSMNSKQIFITCCSPETVGLQRTGSRFRITDGIISEPERL
jgi:DNA replication and repair protein RecF